MTTEEPATRPGRELPVDVAQRIVDEMPVRAAKVLGCMRTAAALIEQAIADDRGLRLAESAGYNVREALDAVVEGRTPVEGGLPAVLEAWRRYDAEAHGPGDDGAAMFTELIRVLRRVAEGEDRNSYHGARLLGYLQARTGVDPLPDDLDPIAEYNRLRREANTAVHAQLGLASVAALYDKVLAWFIRMFTPPDATIRALAELASQPWAGGDQLERLRQLASDPHHVRFFLGRLVDPAWLTPLYGTNFIGVPEPGAAWPAASLLDGLARTAAADVARLLERVLAEVKERPPEQQIAARFELLRVGSQLGVAGHGVVAGVVRLHPDDRGVRSLATATVKRADPSDPVVEQVADAMLIDEPRSHDRYHFELALEQLEAGLNAENVKARTRMLAAKVRNVARKPDMRFVDLDIARLTADLGDDRDYAVVVTHYLARLMARARQLGLSTSDLLTLTRDTPGEIGERIMCQILADAGDLPLQARIDHVTKRLASSTPTGDDYDLITAVMAESPDSELLSAWTEALGTPTPRSTEPAGSVPSDWLRPWRWSQVLPANVLGPWQEPIAEVTSIHGSLTPESLDGRSPQAIWLSGESPYGEDELAVLEPSAAAELVTNWRPDETSRWNLISARALARTLQSVVAKAPDKWSTDPTRIVTILREPTYVLHYVDGLSSNSAHVTARAGAILDALALAKAERWAPTALGNDTYEYEPDWNNVDIATVELAAALANVDADLEHHIDATWAWAVDLIDRSATEGGSGVPSDVDAALTTALNSATGRGLQAVLAMSAWEQRKTGMTRPALVDILDDVLRTRRATAIQHRAILAVRRPVLETVAPDWLEANAAVLFGDDDIGQATFDLTVKTARPTQWLYGKYQPRLIAAAKRNAENAVRWLVIATLKKEPGYTLDGIISGLAGDAEALGNAANEMAFLAQSMAADDPQLNYAIDFWRALLITDRRTVPTSALNACGRWAFVQAIPDDPWLELTAQTLDLTDGGTNMPIEVADRCKSNYTSDRAVTILRALLSKGEPWERDYVARTAVATLQLRTGLPATEESRLLRTRLIERGYHDAADV